MNKDFVPFEIAKKLKAKKFREECFARYHCSDEAYFDRNSYHPDTESVFYCYNNDEDLGRFYIDAPTISQVLKWLREKKKMYIGISPQWQYMIYDMRCNPWIGRSDMQNYDDYTKATLAGIEYVLDNLI